MKRRRKFSKTDRLYVDNKAFYKELIISREKDELTADAVESIMRISERAVNRLKYQSEEDRDDCIATARMKCVKYWRSFNPDKSNNPFAYFTSICINAYAEAFNKLHPVRKGNMISLSNSKIKLI